ncbi:hypothetical protein NSA56_01675 [Oceanobacillus caeni]|uniref:hypothetical protein n=1 Tax=Oceanobacillus caeni TaxID=405946 RepID=UPI002149E814|nr:hypothetical protein [Oceanobacillus caeni]MCR1833105.1 hypothetical protein [Oceanobacillus caeni]
MTVRELIKQLEYYDQNSPVYVDNESTELEVKDLEQKGIYTRVVLTLEKED